MKALRAAVEQREAITPELLRVVEAVAANPLEFARREDQMLHLFAIYLLAQFRETRAYRPIVKMFSAPGETPFDLAGDTVTERLDRILASVYDGDPAPLQGLVETDSVNEYVRSAAIRAFLVLEASGQLSREAVVDYFSQLVRGKLVREFSYTWTAVARAIGALPAPELLEDARQAFRDDLVDGGPRDLDFIEREIREADSGSRYGLTLITDAIGEMEWWAAFHRDREPMKKLPRLKGLPARPRLRRRVEAPRSPSPPPPPPRVKIGRNDPCPCGSGKKYKKCCGK